MYSERSQKHQVLKETDIPNSILIGYRFPLTSVMYEIFSIKYSSKKPHPIYPIHFPLQNLSILPDLTLWASTSQTNKFPPQQYLINTLRGDSPNWQLLLRAIVVGWCLAVSACWVIGQLDNESPLARIAMWGMVHLWFLRCTKLL